MHAVVPNDRVHLVNASARLERMPLCEEHQDSPKPWPPRIFYRENDVVLEWEEYELKDELIQPVGCFHLLRIEGWQVWNAKWALIVSKRNRTWSSLASKILWEFLLPCSWRSSTSNTCMHSMWFQACKKRPKNLLSVITSQVNVDCGELGSMFVVLPVDANHVESTFVHMFAQVASACKYFDKQCPLRPVVKKAENLHPPSSLEEGLEAKALVVKSEERSFSPSSFEDVQGLMVEFVIEKHADLWIAPAAVRRMQVPDVKLVAQCVSLYVCTRVQVEVGCNQPSNTRGTLSGIVSLLWPYPSTCHDCKARKSVCCHRTSMSSLLELVECCPAVTAFLCPFLSVVDHMVHHGPFQRASSRESRGEAWGSLGHQGCLTICPTASHTASGRQVMPPLHLVWYPTSKSTTSCLQQWFGTS